MKRKESLRTVDERDYALRTPREAACSDHDTHSRAQGRQTIGGRLHPGESTDLPVEEAGGCLTKTDMQPLRYNTKDSLLNPYFLVIGDPDYDWSQYL